MIRRTPRSTRTDTLLPYTSSSDLRRRGLLAAIPERGGQQGAGGGAAEDAFLLQQLARGQEAFLVADRVGLLHPAEVGDRRQEVLADALDHPAGGLLAQRALVDVFGQDRADRVGEAHFHARGGLRDAPRHDRKGTRL